LYFLADADGIFDNPNHVDWAFYFLDAGLAIATPFLGGGLKIGTQTLKVFVEKSVVYFKCYFVEKIGVKVSLETTEWGLGKIIINNLHEKPIKEQLKDFIKEDFVLSILQLFFSGGYDYLFREEVN